MAGHQCLLWVAGVTILLGPSRISCADEDAAQEKRQVATAQLAPKSAPQAENIDGSFQVTCIGTEASHLAEIREVHF